MDSEVIQLHYGEPNPIRLCRWEWGYIKLPTSFRAVPLCAEGHDHRADAADPTIGRWTATI